MRFARKKPLHPVHCHSLGYADSKREPLTWMRCSACGYQTLWSSYEPAETCAGRWAGPHDEVLMEPAESIAAWQATAEALDHKPDLIRRAREPR